MAPGNGQGEDAIGADALPTEISGSSPAARDWEKNSKIMALPLRDARGIFEREYLLAQVTRFGGNISRTAAFVGMERSALHRKLKSLGIQSEENSRRNER
jgi:two-component system nitrogen regulation response regulator NtrX